MWELVKDSEILLFEKAKEYYDTKQKATPHSFKERDKVLVRKMIEGKLNCNFMGPFTIIKISDHNAVLEDERGRTRKENVERLKQFIIRTNQQQHRWWLGLWLPQTWVIKPLFNR
uniref:Reverse transcriptase n=1 Tax=Heterorhabditis bacteriophora TaxID=37862 RepID=A0A1I7W7Y3_HETBA